MAQEPDFRSRTNLVPHLRHISGSATYYKELSGEPNPDDEKDDGTRRVARASYVFNAAQIDGYIAGEPPEQLGPVERIEAADRFLAYTGARIEAGGERAYYRPSTDTIHMPDEGLFTGSDTMNRSEAWYAAHWLKLLKEDDRAIFTAAAKASEAVNYLKNLQVPAPEPPDAPHRTNRPGGTQLG